MEMNVSYKGGIRFDVSVRGHNIIVDQPKEQGGKDEGPTPPELFIASLGTCIGVYAVWYCQKHKIPYEGMKVSMTWAKSTNPPARIDMIDATISLPGGCPEEHKKGLHEQAEKCMVHNTIMQTPEINIII
ncbi:MAG: OsmC family protein [Planctomycetes bacterium]|nr:OsmC family protein [Planctomycetota bacterium]